MAREWVKVSKDEDPSQIRKLTAGLRNRDILIIQAQMEKYGLDLSAALRTIITEWHDGKLTVKLTVETSHEEPEK